MFSILIKIMLRVEEIQTSGEFQKLSPINKKIITPIKGNKDLEKYFLRSFNFKNKEKNINKLIEELNLLDEGNKLKTAALIGLLLLGGLSKVEAKDVIQNKDSQTIENIKDNIKTISATDFKNLVNQMVVAAYGKEGLKDKSNIVQAEMIARQNLKKDGIEIKYYADKFKEDITDQAYRVAKRKHDDTKAVRRYSGEPYIVHPTGVAKIAKVYGGNDEEIAAAYLHDTIEDAGAVLEDIEEKFGSNVATIVGDVTNDPYEVRKLGKEEYINQELQTIPDSSLFVKLCDMYYNILDYPTQDQKDRMIRNISTLLNSERGDRLDNRCIDLITACLDAA